MLFYHFTKKHQVSCPISYKVRENQKIKQS